MARLTCPVCGVDIPLPYLRHAQVTEDGMSVTIDVSFGREHFEMHCACTCKWAPENPGEVDYDILCPVHGQPVDAL